MPWLAELRLVRNWKKNKIFIAIKLKNLLCCFSQSMSREEDARKRGDVKGVIDAKASQQKAQFDYAKYTTELQNAQSQRISAGASASQASTAANRAELERLLNPSKILEQEAGAKLKGAQAEAAKAGIESKETKELRLKQEKADDLYNKDPVVRATAKYIDPREGDYKPGTPEYNVLSQYLADVRQSRLDSVMTGKPYVAPPAPMEITEIVEKNFIFPDKKKTTLKPGNPSKPVESAQSSAIPSGLPEGTRLVGTSGDKKVYEKPDGSRVIEK